jgi:hypothetical protein
MNDAAETPVAWTAVAAHTPVIASDGNEVGLARITE